MTALMIDWLFCQISFSLRRREFEKSKRGFTIFLLTSQAETFTVWFLSIDAFTYILP